MKHALTLCLTLSLSTLAWGQPGQDGAAQRIDPNAARGQQSTGSGAGGGVAGEEHACDARRAVALRDLARLERVAGAHLGIPGGGQPRFGPSGGGFPDALDRFADSVRYARHLIGGEDPNWDTVDETLEQAWELSDSLIDFRRTWETQQRAAAEVDHLVRKVAREVLIPALPGFDARHDPNTRALNEALERMHGLLARRSSRLADGRVHPNVGPDEVATELTKATRSALALAAPSSLDAENGYDVAGGVARGVITTALQPAVEQLRRYDDWMVLSDSGKAHRDALQAGVTTLRDELDGLDQAMKASADMHTIQARVEGVMNAGLALQKLHAASITERIQARDE